MTTARCKIVDLDETRYYHCISRCVRGAFLCGDGFDHRKRWLESRLEYLAGCFAISVAGFAIMDNHFHVLIRVDLELVKGWSDQEVVRRWLMVYPPRGIDFGNDSSVRFWVDHYSQNPKKVAAYRERLADMGWFMKALKQPLSRMANKEDGCRGAFWEGRYKSIGVLDETALLATCVYIDLNPVAAGKTKTPETSEYTSVRQRVAHVAQKVKLDILRSARIGSIHASRKIGNADQDHWLIPLEDRRPHTNSKPSSQREGMLEKFTVGSYLLLVDFTGRLVRKGKARITDGIKPILDRLSSSLEFWQVCLTKMFQSQSLRGHRFAVAG